MCDLEHEVKEKSTWKEPVLRARDVAVRQTASSSGWWMTGESDTEGCWSKSPGRGSEQDRKWTDSLKFGERFCVKEAKEQKTRRWQRPREKTAAVRAREEGARIRDGAVLSSFASVETNEQVKVRIVVPVEVAHDTRICIEDLVDMEIDQLKDDEKKEKQPWNGTQEFVWGKKDEVRALRRQDGP